MSDRKKNITRYIINDYVFSVITWLIFAKGIRILNINQGLFLQALLFSAGWILFYAFAGSYHRSLYEKSRLNELTATLTHTFIGSLVLLLLPIDLGIYSMGSFITYYLLQCMLVFAGRSFLLHQVKKSLIKGDIFFNTLIVGNNVHAVKLYKELNRNFKYLGFKTLGFITVDGDSKNGLSKWIPNLGSTKEVSEVIDQYHIEKVILALDKSRASLLKTW